MKTCTPKGRDCIEKNSAETFNCSMTCEGMYADIYWKDGKMKNEMDKEKYAELSSEYVNFKRENVKHFEFSSAPSYSWGSIPNYGKKIKLQKNENLLSGRERPNSTLQLVQIYFDTATFDDIEKDKKIKIEAQLSLIGGTMGLLTGFSIISGVEIIFFLFRLILLSTSSLAIIIDPSSG